MARCGPCQRLACGAGSGSASAWHGEALDSITSAALYRAGKAVLALTWKQEAETQMTLGAGMQPVPRPLLELLLTLGCPLRAAGPEKQGKSGAPMGLPPVCMVPRLGPAADVRRTLRTLDRVWLRVVSQ